MIFTETSYRYVEISIDNSDGSSTARLERGQLAATGTDSLRLSWWKDGKYCMNALILTAPELRQLLKKATEEGILPA